MDNFKVDTDFCQQGKIKCCLELQKNKNNWLIFRTFLVILIYNTVLYFTSTHAHLQQNLLYLYAFVYTYLMTL
jgi:uncharacterized membrane protein YobD (UPF0266 family)